MAELTDEQKEIASLKAQLADYQKANAVLKEAAQTGTKVLPIEGTFKAKVREGTSSKETEFGFKDGYVYIRDEKAIIYHTEGVIKIANGEEIDDDMSTKHPSLLSLNQQSAKNLLQNLVNLGFMGLKTV